MAESSGAHIKGGLSGETSSTLPRSIRFGVPPETAITQRSTQIVGNDVIESDFNDSDAEENNRREELRQARTEKQVEPVFVRRRYIIEAGDLEDELFFIEVEDGLEEEHESIFAKVRNVPEFIASATAYPEKWCNAVRSFVISMIAY